MPETAFQDCFERSDEMGLKYAGKARPENILMLSEEEAAKKLEAYLKDHPNRGNKQPEIRVVNQDAIRAAAHFVALDSHIVPCVVNCANADVVGGWKLEKGIKTQETDLMRCSNYYKGVLVCSEKQLYPKDDQYYRLEYKKALHGSGNITTTSIVAFKVPRNVDDRNDYFYYDEIAPFIMSGIAVAAHDLRYAQTEGVTKPSGAIDYEKYEREIESKIRSLIYTAIVTEHTTLLPGALGCGIFKSPDEGKGKIPIGYTATLVAKLYKKILIDEGYAQYFDHICFPILDKLEIQPGTAHNTQIFQQVFGLDQNLARDGKGSSRVYQASPKVNVSQQSNVQEDVLKSEKNPEKEPEKEEPKTRVLEKIWQALNRILRVVLTPFRWIYHSVLGKQKKEEAIPDTSEFSAKPPRSTISLENSQRSQSSVQQKTLTSPSSESQSLSKPPSSHKS